MCTRAPQTFDIVICLGGDGTVLYASWLFQHIIPPVLSFGLGSLGFLTKFDFGDYQNTLRRVFSEGFNVSLRLRFEATVMRSNKREDKGELTERDVVEELVGEESTDEYTHRPDLTSHVLNEVVIDRGPSGSKSKNKTKNPFQETYMVLAMTTLELFGDHEHFTTIQADGVCIATPTGSTAYNLAAGGSLCHPDNPVILVSAICAHTLSFRPIILPDTIVLRIGVPYDSRTNPWASFDGKER
jgi:NAD+ kinase